MKILVGKTGFVGSNLWESGSFDKGFHSKDIRQAYGLSPELLVYAGLRAEKYLANQNSQADYALIEEAQENIRQINPKKLVLISTVDVYKNPCGVDENSPIDTTGLHPYGYNRYRLEQWVRENYQDALIIRLPALYGKNIKKNFIYDFIHVIPSMLKKEKMEELLAKAPELQNFYELQENGFYKCGPLTEQEREALKEQFKGLGFTALHFTDSRSRFQFYPLGRLWKDMETALEQELRLWNPAVEPVTAGEVYQYLTGESFQNELAGKPADYDCRTLYAGLFGGEGGYIMSRQAVLEDLKVFAKEQEV